MNNLKKTFNEKMQVETGRNFDAHFMAKLEKSKSSKNLFLKWYSWAGAAGATLVLFLFIMKGHYSVGFPNQQYVDTLFTAEDIVNESLFDEDVYDDSIDLTSELHDEI